MCHVYDVKGYKDDQGKIQRMYHNFRLLCCVTVSVRNFLCAASGKCK